MKKSKLLVLGLIALMLVGGLVLASCEQKCDGGCNVDTQLSSCAQTSDGTGHEKCDNKCGGCGVSNCK